MSTRLEEWRYNGTRLRRRTRTDRDLNGLDIAAGITPPPGFTTFSEDQFVSNAGRWSVYNNSSFGMDAGNERIQAYMTGNTSFGTGASSGATNGTSLRLQVKRENVVLAGVTKNFTAGMVDSKSASVWYPRYGYFEIRCKTPHGQGLWPAWWLTAKSGGASMCEWDILEYFHSQLPGKNSSTLHGSPSSTSGLVSNRFTNNTNRTFFETPTYTPGWHKWATEILPVTDSTGTTIGDVTQPSQNVRFKVFLDGVEVYSFVDTSALYWSTNGGTEDSFWNVYIQGCQVDGAWVGHPDDELGYSHQKDLCLISGTPGACVASRSGYPILRAGAAGATATMGTPASCFELDYHYVAKKIPV